MELTYKCDDYDIEMVYKVDGIIFETKEDALNHIKSRNEKQEKLSELLEKRKQIKEDLAEEYIKNEYPLDKCNCGKFSIDYSRDCLKHFCTCNDFDKKYKEKEYDHYICEYHTNISYRNKGCYWCGYKDCGKYMC